MNPLSLTTQTKRSRYPRLQCTYTCNNVIIIILIGNSHDVITEHACKFSDESFPDPKNDGCQVTVETPAETVTEGLARFEP